MVQKVTSQAEARVLLEQQEALKKRAARQATKTVAAPVEIPTVECTVLPMGDGRISMGEHIAGLGTAHYDEGEKFTTEIPVAVALYDRGFVNFDGARQASRDAAEARVETEARAQAADFRLKKLLEENA